MSILQRAAQARAGLGFAERVGILSASTSVGQSFARGLMPRSTIDQAIVTGASATLNYAAMTLSESVIESVAVRATGHRASDQEFRAATNGLLLAANVAAAGIGYGMYRLLAHRKDEPISRAWGRTAFVRLAVGGGAGAVIVGSDMALVRAVGDDGRFSGVAPIALPLGMALAAVQYQRLRRGMVDAGVTHDAEGVSLDESQAVSVGRALAVGTGVGAGLLTFASAERFFAHQVGRGLSATAPSLAPVGRPLGHLTALGLMGYGGFKGMEYVFHKAETAGDAVEATYATPPTSLSVSGGPRSNVSWEDIGREGRRFVNMAVPTEEILDVMGPGETKEPVRVFVGLESAPTTSQRADLAMREMEALGAFERSLIVFMSPTGTGYLNYVTAESLEFLSRGDVATVGIQYSLRPSPLSLGRVNIGIDQNNSFLHALKWRLSAIPEERRPRLAIFGESLGAQTSEDIFADEGTEGLHRVGIDRGLFLGTPAATKFRQKWLSNPEQMDPEGEIVEVASHEEYLALPDDVRQRARYFMLTHHNDSMPKFWFPLAVQSPQWLGPPETREPGLPTETRWRPYTTFLITLMDVKNAMHVIPGQFVADGHDYRKDLAVFASLAYNLPVQPAQLERLERILRRRELAFAERRLVDQQFADAQQAVTNKLSDWGVPEESVPTLVSKSVTDREIDQYAAEGTPDAATLSS